MTTKTKKERQAEALRRNLQRRKLAKNPDQDKQSFYEYAEIKIKDK